MREGPRTFIGSRLGKLAVRADDPFQLGDGSRVAVIGGGPAGSLFAYFLLQMAHRVGRAGLRLSVDVYEPKDFSKPGPSGCNMCGGVISEYLVQTLAAEGINLPEGVVQRGLDSYVVHMPEGSVHMETAVGERRLAAVHRGSGPRGAGAHTWQSFDGFLLEQAQRMGARVIRGRVASLARDQGRLVVGVRGDDTTRTYDLVAAATGVNSSANKLVAELDIGYQPPRLAKAYVAELPVGRRWIDGHIGTSMHIFLLDLPGLEFGALLPKGEYLTLCLLGRGVDGGLIERFLATPEVRGCLPPGWRFTGEVCQCHPKLALQGVRRPFADRLVLLGDCGVTRLYKDGIGAAYRTAKAAAVTAIFDGVSAAAFAGHFMRTCDSIRRDNRFGKAVFGLSALTQKTALARAGLLRMIGDEQKRAEGAPRRMSAIMWDTFSGTAPYGGIARRGVHPAVLARFAWSTLLGAAPGPRESKAGVRR